MDTFVDSSSGINARFTAPWEDNPTDPSVADAWLPVDQYIAASSMRSCTCSIPASSPARCAKTGHVGLDEPFKGLFTQGMVVHETYSRARGPSANGLSPHRSASRKLKARARPICSTRRRSRHRLDREDVEVQEECRRSDDIIASYGADTARFFVLSDSPRRPTAT